MCTINLRGVSVSFPCEPYEIQKQYMEKVLECIQERKNGVLESPTGTGKTLSLLCSSLAWLSAAKAQVETQRIQRARDPLAIDLPKDLLDGLEGGRSFIGLPVIIYASRTHSQLSQAMQELKRTAYSNLKACILGSRDQLCIHPEVVKETANNMKVQMCRLKVQTRTCQFYNRVESLKEDAAIRDVHVVDIEDIVRLGEKKRFCPYYMTRQLKDNADIIFLPYNYLLDVKMRKTLGIELAENIVILDEAHNIEHVCEESASVQIMSTDIALCIDEVTSVMKAMTEEATAWDTDVPKDFSASELCRLKEIFLEFEKALDAIAIGSDGTIMEGDFLIEMMQQAGIGFKDSFAVSETIDKMVQFLSAEQVGPFQRKGAGVQQFQSLLEIVFMENSPTFREKIKKCYKVHLKIEENRKNTGNDWLSKASSLTKQNRVLSYWCFSPGFGMNMMMRKGLRSLILTSGTLSPLKALISELELDVTVQLENPHIVKGDQVCVKVVSKGPDMENLLCTFANRDNPRYISSLGRTILNLTRIIPDGILVFFPSYPIMRKCHEHWQSAGIWSDIANNKPIFVEPKQKDAFNTTMADYYARISDPNFKGAMFMGVCRGKVSEGLDFADINGRAVIVIGLPYPPLKDPRIILKKKYLDACHSINKEYLTGDEWYSLEASRAVNQAIGRVIRHQHDYGAIILLDSRFTGFRIKSQMSLWLRDHIKHINNFGEIVRDLRTFYRNADTRFPSSNKFTHSEPISLYKSSGGGFDFTGTSFGSASQDSGLVSIHSRRNAEPTRSSKRAKITIVPQATETLTVPETTSREYIAMVKGALNPEDFHCFVKLLGNYRDTTDFDRFIRGLDQIFLPKFNIRYIIQGLEPYIRDMHKSRFETYWERMRL